MRCPVIKETGVITYKKDAIDGVFFVGRFNFCMHRRDLDKVDTLVELCDRDYCYSFYLQSILLVYESHN